MTNQPPRPASPKDPQKQEAADMSLATQLELKFQRRAIVELTQVYLDLFESYKDTLQKLLRVAKDNTTISRKDLVSIIENVPGKIEDINNRVVEIHDRVKKSHET